MEEMERHKKRRRNKPIFSLPSSELKRFTDRASMNDGEGVEHYLKIREQKVKKIKFYDPKPINIVKREKTSITQPNTDSIISSALDIKMEKALVNKNKRLAMQNHSTVTNTNKSNDRLVIELKDYLTLTETRNIIKFKLKPISDEPDKVSSIDDIIKTANTVQFNQILNYGISNQEPQRTFLLVPQNKDDSVTKKSNLYMKQTNRKKSILPSDLSSPVKILQKIEQINHKKSNNQLISKRQSSKCSTRLSNLSNSVKTLQKMEQINCKKFSNQLQNARKKSKSSILSSELSSDVKTLQKIEQTNHKKSRTQLTNAQKNLKNSYSNVNTKYSEFNIQSPEKEIHPVIKVLKKVQFNNSVSNTDNITKTFIKGKKKVILKSHPYFLQHKPFVIKHKPIVTKVIEDQNYSVKNQQNLSNEEINLDNILKCNELIDEIKFEVPEHDLNFVMSPDRETIDQIFPVALKSSDSDDFEYLGFETNNDDISPESEMQILGI